ncbi:amidase [soil metagenome]
MSRPAAGPRTIEAMPSSTTSRAQVEQSLARIADVDALVRAVCTLDPTALEQADARDAEEPRGPLHGVPVLVKDNVDTAGLATTAGSLALAGAEPPLRDAELVRRLRAAGMVVLGKTNLSEWANFRDGESTSGWSAYGGLTRNPYGLNRSPGGSSSGSGAAVAAGLAGLAVGTETDGSITSPAAFNGCVGLKPTVGSVPTSGVVPISSSQDAPGALASTVAGAAALLDVLTGGDSLTVAAASGGLVGRRIGVPRAPWWGYSRHADAAGEEALRLLADAAAVLVDDVDLGELATYEADDELTVLLAEFRAEVRGYLATRTGADVPRDLEELIAFNLRHADAELAHFGQTIFEAALGAPGVDSTAYAEARARCVAVSRGGIDRALAEHGLDALLTPSYAPAPPIDLVNAEHSPGACTRPTAMAGYPLLTVPVHLAGGLPVAVSFWGTAGSEATLVEVAAGFKAARDRAIGPLPPPTFPVFV